MRMALEAGGLEWLAVMSLYEAAGCWGTLGERACMERGYRGIDGKQTAADMRPSPWIALSPTALPVRSRLGAVELASRR